MDFIQISAKTKQDAISRAMEKFNVDEEKLDIQVLDEGSKGFLGIGAKDCIINVRKKITKEDLIRDFIQDVYSSLGIKPNIDIVMSKDETSEKENIYVSITGEETSILIGRRGESLDSLQMLINIIVNKEVQEHERIILDIENYREKREQSLVQYAKKMAKKAVYQRRSIKLEPMNPYERRIIHYALQNDPKINTFSEGEEPNRRIVLSLKKGQPSYKSKYKSYDSDKK